VAGRMIEVQGPCRAAPGCPVSVDW
jgi:hypothetical protein